MANAQKLKPIVVVGAGIAGLSAAAKLSCHGRHVILLEAQDKCGGRVLSVQHGSRVYDLGASWLHDIDNNPLYDIAQGTRLQLQLETNENFIMLSAKESSETDSKTNSKIEVNEISDVREKLRAAHRILDNIGDDASSFDMSLKAYTDKYIDSTDREAFRAYEFFVGLPWTQISAVETAPDLLDHGTDAFQLGGNDKLVDWLLNKCTKNVDLRLNTPVKSIGKNENDECYVLTSAGERIECSNVIVTAPLWYLKTNYRTLFMSPIPEELTSAMANATIACLGKAVLEFSKQFWDPKMERVVVVMNDASIMLSNVYKHTSGNPTLMVFAPGELGKRLEACSNDSKAVWEIIKPACNALAVRNGFVDPIPGPTYVLASNWTQNQFIGGAYSSLGVGQNMRDLVLPMMQGAWDDRLLFAGEHSTIRGIGCMDGAYVSGIAAADKIMQC